MTVMYHNTKDRIGCPTRVEHVW